MIGVAQANASIQAHSPIPPGEPAGSHGCVWPWARWVRQRTEARLKEF